MSLVPFSGVDLSRISEAWPLLGTSFLLAYLIGSTPFAYLVVRAATGENITEHGTGNVGAMNVRRSTGSWIWFIVAMLADLLKGLAPVLVVELMAGALGSLVLPIGSSSAAPFLGHTVLAELVVAGCVLGHNYSVWMALITKRFGRTGKGLATGAGALLAYDWRYFLAVVVIGLGTIAITRYMMAGQVAAAAALPVAALALRQPDWPFALLMGLIVYSAHHRRFVGLLRGQEPRLYVEDRMGPRG